MPWRLLQCIVHYPERANAHDAFASHHPAQSKQQRSKNTSYAGDVYVRLIRNQRSTSRGVTHVYTASKAVGRVLLIWLAVAISSARAAITRDWSSWTSWNCASSRQYSVHRCAKCATKLQSSSNQVSGRKQRLVHASEALRCRRTCMLRYNAVAFRWKMTDAFYDWFAF